MTGPEIFLAVMGAALLVLGIVTYIRDNRNTNLNHKERKWRWISTVAFLSAGGVAVGVAIISAIRQ
jgi:multisubunit Na+/H+ antiporter MnhB subunit